MKKPGILLAILLGTLLANCTFTQKITDGKSAHERKQFAVAATLLKKEYNKSKSRVEKGKIAFLLADSYRELNQSDLSIDWYQIAYNNQYGVDALKEYAFALKRAERFEEAIQAFKELGIEIGSPYEYRREIKAIENAVAWAKDKRAISEYQVEVMPFNTGFADYAPALFQDNQLVITSDRTASTGEDTYKWTGNHFSDLFLVDLTTNTVASFDKRLNTEDNEGTVAFSQDFSQIIFCRCFGPKKEDAYCKLMFSERRADAWTPPVPLGFIKDGVNYGQPALSADGKTLYFASNDPEGWGGFDIWTSERATDGSWEEPRLLSRSINTIGNEKFPYIDGDTLYFSSDFHPGIGGLDIFRTYKINKDTWAPAQNLKMPINSGGDDFGLVIDHQAPKKNNDVLQVGYFTSTRASGIGNDDIFRFEKRPLPPEPPKPEIPAREIVYRMILDGYVLEKIFSEPGNPNSQVLGRKPLPGARVNILSGKEKKEVTVDEEGFFTMELNPNTDYEFIASMEGYLNNKTDFSTRGIGTDPENPEMHFEIEIVLDRIFLDKEIVLENIYYDFDRWEIRNDAKPTLDKLAQDLRLNPEIRIQLSSHTDCRGTTSYNEDLSQKRAQSAVDYLISLGIDPGRMIAKGYGESEPAVNCICARCTEEEHQANRRTTFKIIE